jgi:hypothetical protein
MGEPVRVSSAVVALCLCGGLLVALFGAVLWHRSALCPGDAVPAGSISLEQACPGGLSAGALVLGLGFLLALFGALVWTQPGDRIELATGVLATSGIAAIVGLYPAATAIVGGFAPLGVLLLFPAVGGIIALAGPDPFGLSRPWPMEPDGPGPAGPAAVARPPTAAPVATLEPEGCPSCGWARHDAEAAYCSRCGARLGATMPGA